MRDMQNRGRIAGLVLAVAALLTPAVSAQADDPFYPINAPSITLGIDTPALYPVVDGYRDTLGFDVDLFANGTERLRGAVTLSTGNRVVKSWVLSQTDFYHFDWNGRIGSTIVPGPYQIT